MKRVYVAGSYNGSNILESLSNMRVGMNASLKVLKAGFAPFCPWFDYHFSLLDDSLNIEDYYNYSMAWLEVSDAVYVCNWRNNSVGTKKEVERARQIGIPVYFSMDELLKGIKEV